MFGTKMTDEFFAVHTGGDVAFVNGVLKQLLAIGRHRPRVRHRRTPSGFDGVLERARGRVVRSTSKRRRARPRADMERFAAHVRATRTRRCSCGRWGSPSTSTASTTSQRSSTSGSRAATSAVRAPGSCRSAATRACRAAPRWAATPPRSPAASRSTRAQRRRPRGRSGASRFRRPAGPRPRRRWSRPRARGEHRRAVVERRQLPRRAARARHHVAPPSRARRCACTKTSCVTHQMLVDPGETVVLLPAATRYEQDGGGTSTTTERRVAFSPEIAGPRVGEARSRSGRSSSTSPGASDRNAPIVSGARRRRRSATRSRASCPRTRASSHLRETGDAIQVGGARLCEGGVVPDARRHGPLQRGRARRTERASDGRFVLSTRRGQAVQLDGVEGRRPAHRRRRATRCFLSDVGRRRARASRDGDAVLVRSRLRRDAGAACTSRRSAPGNVQAFFPEANVLLVAEPSRPDLRRARLQRGRRGGPGRDDARRAARAASSTRPTRSPCAVAAIDRDAIARPHRSSPASTRSTSSPTPPRSPC